MRRFRSLTQIIRLRGAGYLWYVGSGVILPRLTFSAVALQSMGRRRLAMVALATLLVLDSAVFLGFGAASAAALPALCGVVVAVWLALRKIRWRRALAAARAHAGASAANFLGVLDWLGDVEPESSRASLLESEVELFRIDNDGRWLAMHPAVAARGDVAAEDFVERYRYGLSIVAVDGALLVRKDFRGDSRGFQREWLALTAVAGRLNAPAVHHVDEGRQLLYKSFIAGRTLREDLVAAGADILTVNTSQDAALAALSGEKRTEAVWKRGRDVLDELRPGRGRLSREHLVGAMIEQMNAIHRRGVTGLSLTFGNVVVDSATGEPWLIDFDGARVHSDIESSTFRYHRDRDRVLFGRIYGEDLMTESVARSVLAAQTESAYAPVDFGLGLVSRGFWTVDSGTGRWEVLNRQVVAPLVAGKRVLDLGTNNGVMPLMMLRDGAQSVLAVERERRMIDHAGDLLLLLEWRDLRSYGLDLVHTDIRDFMASAPPTFDVVTAFCSLYYLDEAEMAEVIRQASRISPVVILQAKGDTRSDAADRKALKSSLSFSELLLRDNGFEEVEVFSRTGHPRPLIVGKRRQLGCRP